MTIIIAIFQVLLLFVVIFLFYHVWKSKNAARATTEPSDRIHKITTLDDWVKAFLILAIFLFILSIAAPFLFTTKSFNRDFDFTQTGQIGDTIGGLMNPFIAMAGVIVTGLAFYIQYKANLLQRELFFNEQENSKTQFQEQQDASRTQFQKQIELQNSQLQLQQFESQFYEMLRLHRENINEMKISGYDFEEGRKLTKVGKTTEARKVFVTMQTELECLLKFFSIDRQMNQELYHKCYKLFFSGLDDFEKYHPEESVYIGVLNKAREKHKSPGVSITSNRERKLVTNDLSLNFNYKPFSGHASRLGHYFRHLYLTVKSVATSEVVTTYDERMKYLRILRAQLSNHEQILLFYNWLGGHGDNWENEEQHFFTEYCMIHNLWYDQLFENPFIASKVNDLRIKEVKLRKGPMFEID